MSVRQWISVNSQNGGIIWDTSASDKYIHDIVLKRSAGSIPSLTFTVESGGTVPASNSVIYAMCSDGTTTKQLFYGTVAESTQGFYNSYDVTCEGFAACLNEIQFAELKMQKTLSWKTKNSKHKKHKYTKHTKENQIYTRNGTIYILGDDLKTQIGLLQQLINKEMPSGKTLTLSVDTSASSIGRAKIEFESGNALDLISDIAEDVECNIAFDGNTITFVSSDYSKSTVSGSVEFAENLKDFSNKRDYTRFTTAIIPWGTNFDDTVYYDVDGSYYDDWHKLDLKYLYGTEGYDDIQRIKIPGDGDDRYYYAIVNTEMAAKYGLTYTQKQWNSTSNVNNLYTRAKKYLNRLISNEGETTTLTVDAIDETGMGIYEPYDLIHCEGAAGHGLSTDLPVKESEMHLGEPDKDTVTIGLEANSTITGSTSSVSDQTKGIIKNIANSVVNNYNTSNSTNSVNYTIQQFFEENNYVIAGYYNPLDSQVYSTYDTESGFDSANIIDGDESEAYLCPTVRKATSWMNKYPQVFTFKNLDGTYPPIEFFQLHGKTKVSYLPEWWYPSTTEVLDYEINDILHLEYTGSGTPNIAFVVGNYNVPGGWRQWIMCAYDISTGEYISQTDWANYDVTGYWHQYEYCATDKAKSNPTSEPYVIDKELTLPENRVIAASLTSREGWTYLDPDYDALLEDYKLSWDDYIPIDSVYSHPDFDVTVGYYEVECSVNFYKYNQNFDNFELMYGKTIVTDDYVESDTLERVEHLTQEEYDALTTKATDTEYIIDDGGEYTTLAAVATTGKYDDLVDVPTEFNPKAHTHTKSQITDFAHTHTKSDITDMPTALSEFTDDVVAGNYLPLTGGELSGALSIDGNSLEVFTESTDESTGETTRISHYISNTRHTYETTVSTDESNYTYDAVTFYNDHIQSTYGEVKPGSSSGTMRGYYYYPTLKTKKNTNAKLMLDIQIKYITQAEYDALSSLQKDTTYIITDAKEWEVV